VVDSSPTSATPVVSPPPRLSRRRFLKRCAALSAAPLALGVYSTQLEPFWLDVHERSIPVRGLPAAFSGFRLAHLSDLHVGHNVPLWYMRHVMRCVNALRPDLIVVTGDLVHHTLDGVQPVTDLLGMLHAPVVVSLGNHDYDNYPGGGGGPIRQDFIAVALQEHLAARGIPVLRNRATPIERGGGRLWIVGLEDYYTERFSPAKAFAAVPAGEPAVVLSHNPDTAFFFESCNAPLILCGHTHGGQVRIPFFGPPILPLAHRELDQGLHTVNQSRLYVSRGVGYLRRIRFNCRPELPCLQLQPDAG
jgi:predicted MPP superfamily phosphohydrolase